jgi:hypothetical protein
MKKKKEKEYYSLLSLQIPEVDIGFRINMSAERANKLTFDKYKLKPADNFGKFSDDGSTKGQMVKIKSGGYAIWVKDIKDYKTLLHEIVHVVQYMYRDRRTPMTEDTEEVYAYSIQYIFFTIFNEIKK